MLIALALWALRRRPRIARLLPNLTLAFFTVLLCLIVVERPFSAIFHRPPLLKIEIVKNPLPVVGSGVSTVFTTNELDMRGPPVKDKA
jgi:hypothetical protein